MLESPFADARILVVDDEESNVHSLTRILRAAGHRNVLWTTDPRTVVGLYQKQDPDVILLDLHMPNLDGLGVRVDAIRAGDSYGVNPPIARGCSFSPQPDMMSINDLPIRFGVTVAGAVAGFVTFDAKRAASAPHHVVVNGNVSHLMVGWRERRLINGDIVDAHR